MTVHDYMVETGLVKAAAHARLRNAWDAKLIFIAEYRRQKSGPPTPAYAIGSLPDAPQLEAIPVIDKVLKYQQSEKGKATLAKSRKKQRAKHKKRMEKDFAYAEAVRAYQRIWAQKKYGHKPRRPIVRVEKHDPLLAALMGRKVA
jgi:hypothetical protein